MGLSVSEIVLEYACPALGVVCANIMFAAPLRDCYNAVNAGQGLQALNPLPWAFMLGNTFGWITYGIVINNLFVFFGNAPGFLFAVWLNLNAVKLQYESFRNNEMRKAIVEALQGARGGNTKDCAENGTLQEVVREAINEKMTPGSNDGDGDAVETIVWQVTGRSMAAPAPQDLLVLLNVAVWMILVSLISFGTAFTDRTKELIVGVAVNLNLVVFYAAPLSTIWTVLKTRNAATIHILT
jgi:solute carrier family 50 (sugar transporter)